MEIVEIYEEKIEIKHEEWDIYDYIEYLENEDLTNNYLYIIDEKNGVVVEIHKSSLLYFDYEDPITEKPIIYL